MSSSTTTATTVRKAKSAFLFYQGDQLAKIRADLNLSMGDAMTEVSVNHSGDGIVRAVVCLGWDDYRRGGCLLGTEITCLTVLLKLDDLSFFFFFP